MSRENLFCLRPRVNGLVKLSVVKTSLSDWLAFNTGRQPPHVFLLLCSAQVLGSYGKTEWRDRCIAIREATNEVSLYAVCVEAFSQLWFHSLCRR